MLPRGEVGCRALNGHGNYIIDHGKIMEKSWNFVFEFLWEPCGKVPRMLFEHEADRQSVQTSSEGPSKC